ncbi:MAG: ice-binding family protein [Bacteroidota bacterium]|nr:ice-binding family protein [Bacteroidota bacterium]MDP4228861.1 ice-binding family protein [Bacteroidota bacterium]
MTQFTTLKKQAIYLVVLMAVCLLSGVSFGQQAQSPQAGPSRPNLGTASTYAIFTGGGAINNTGPSVIVGDIGQDGAYAFNGFPPGTYTGTLNRNNGASALAKSDLLTAWTTNAAVPCGIVLGTGIVDGQSFDPQVYCSGGASTTTGNITFDAHGDGTAIFIVKIGGQLDANAGTHILLANNAQSNNIYWFVDGAVNVADNSSFKGTIFARGAITFHGTSSLDGRALVAPLGAITLSSNSMIIPGGGPGNNLTVLTPAMGDSIKAGTKNYQITWTGTGITSRKVFEYSLDSGLTWKTIDTITADVFTHKWDIPDTVSNKAIVRITDQNGLIGLSGVFIIARSTNSGSITVIRPSAGEMIPGGTQNYQITWSGSGLTLNKAIELSLDGGLTWNLIGTTTTDAFTYSWNVPNTPSTQAMIRITDDNNVSGKSGLFTITSPTPGSIVIIHPAAGEVIAGGTVDYQITFTSVNTTQQKTLSYSLDGGTNWSLIGFLNSDAQSFSWASVPNVSTTQALVRITDANGVTGTSGLFTITMTAGVGSMNSLTLSGLDSKNNIGNAKTLGISWTFTPDIGTSVKVEVSLDGMMTWIQIADNPIAEPQTSWTTPNAGNYNPVFVRVTSTKGMTLTSIPFSIGSSASVSSKASMNGYSVSNYPNPVQEATTITFTIPVESDISLKLYDVIGREVESLLTRHFEAGTHSIPFHASLLAPGMYSYLLQAGSTSLVGKMNIIK